MIENSDKDAATAQSNAADYIALLRNPTSARALNSAWRRYVLELMKDVESDQRRGVSAAADKGTTVRLKNGWLTTDSDHDLWLVKGSARSPASDHGGPIVAGPASMREDRVWPSRSWSSR